MCSSLDILAQLQFGNNYLSLLFVSETTCFGLKGRIIFFLKAVASIDLAFFNSAELLGFCEMCGLKVKRDELPWKCPSDF